MGRKLKVYLDTSVVSHLMQEDVPEKMEDTRKLWEMFRNGVYEVCLSTVTLQEIDDCSEPKRSHLWKFLNQIEYKIYDVTEDALDVARQIISLGVLTKKSFDDCQHIVTVKTIRGVRAITNLQGYKPIEIWSPSILLESEE